ncbi:MAG: DMT family transporter [Aeromonadales bacterium]|nr:DMT family transporter [Aeromonadales bacterium]MDY2890902.1 DMT family transporter [Succinivibrio sp.]
MGGHRILAGCACAVSCETLFGLSYLFTKDALAGASELALLGWRFLAGVIAMAFCAAFGIMKVKLRGRKLGLLSSIALFSPVLYFIGETFGIGRTSASESGAFLACIPVAALRHRPSI